MDKSVDVSRRMTRRITTREWDLNLSDDDSDDETNTDADAGGQEKNISSKKKVSDLETKLAANEQDII